MGLIAVLSGLAAAITWGAGDFAGGLASRTASALRVVPVSQLAGAVALLALAALWPQSAPRPADLLWGALAGLAGAMGLSLLYVSLARGKMGVAAPLTAVAAGGIPVAVGLLTAGLPDTPQLAGFALALVAIWVISSADGSAAGPGDIVLPLLSGVGFGGFLTLIGRISQDAGFVWPLVAAKFASMAAVLLVSLVARARHGTGRDSAGPPATLMSFPWGVAALAGIGDAAGNAFFALSAQSGRLDVAAVLSSLYPASTVILARLVLDERLTRRQGLGVGLALAAVVLIAL